MQPIYLDNAASTRVADDVVALMTEVMRTAWGNPSSQHPQGAAARTYIEAGRGRVLAALGGARMREGHVVTSSIEHAAVSEAATRSGREVRFVDPGPDGVLDPDVV